MALVKGTNSYVSLEEADLYFIDRIDVAAWQSASDLQKNQALITATGILDNLNWTGIAVSATQPLAFPRDGSYFEPRTGKEEDLSGTIALNRINKACYELAYHFVNNDGLLDSTGDVLELKVGNISLGNIRKTSTIPILIRDIIKPLLISRGSNTWWRAN